MYCAEALQRMYFYPAPVWNGAWGYYTPYMWYDGDKGSTSYSTWQSQVQSRLLLDAPATITMWGDWSPATLTGTVYAKFRNDSTVTLNGLVNFVVTEDSIYRVTPNGDQWHNHVARDYLPTQAGESVSIPAGDSVTKSRTFTLNSIWNLDMIEFVAWIQNPTMAADTTREIWQGATLDIDELGIAEYVSEVPQTYNVAVTPNPCSDAARFTFTLPSSAQYGITIYDISGRVVRTFHGNAAGSEENVAWNLRDETGVRVSSGVYLYRFESEGMKTTGKVVVR